MQPAENVIVLGGGCFWCLDAVFRQVKGILSSECGYSGGNENDATYYAVTSGATGHAEVVRLTYDIDMISPSTILDIFFSIHDPTSKNRQGADAGPQYRSVVFYKTADQHQQIKLKLKEVQRLWNKPIITEVVPLEHFYKAEEEHQDYFSKNPDSGYCTVVINPKLTKLKSSFREYLKS